jgi:hypothetical protein
VISFSGRGSRHGTTTRLPLCRDDVDARVVVPRSCALVSTWMGGPGDGDLPPFHENKMIAGIAP